MSLKPTPPVPPESVSNASASMVTVPPAFVVGLTSSNILKEPLPTGKV